MADARLDGLVEAARSARTRAYAPYSEFAVGAAALGGARIFTGGNVENASFPVSVCAERNAVAAMLDGGQQRLDAIAIVTDAAAPAPPCGACRQVLWEFGPSAMWYPRRSQASVSCGRSRTSSQPRSSEVRGEFAGRVPQRDRRRGGRPNVGKSTLVNALVGQKVAIVSNKPQTTQRDIRAIWNTEGAQIVFTDTPGYHKPKTLLGLRLNDLVGDAVDGVDLIVQVVDAAAGIGTGDAFVYREKVAPAGAPAICVVNKVDAVQKRAELPQLLAAAELGAFDEIVPMSAKLGKGIGLLRT